MVNRIILGFTVAILASFGVYKVLSLPKQSTTPLATPPISASPSSSVTPGQPITARGEVVCLPSKNNSGITTMGCAIGLKIEDGTYWGLNNIQTDLVNAKFGNGDIIEVTGTQNNAIINVTSTRVIKKGTTPPVLGVSTSQLDLTASITEPISSSPYVKVYVKRFTIPSTINITDVSGSLTLTSGLPYISQGAFAIWYNAKGNCPTDGSVYPNYNTIWNGENISLFWMNTILSKPNTISVPTVFHFPVKRAISGCGFMTFDMAAYPNTSAASSGLTLTSNVTLHYDTDTPVSPQPYLAPVGAETCFGSDQGCTKATTCISGNCAFMNVTKIISPTYLWSLFGDVNAGVFTGAPYADPPSGPWSASQDTYIYKDCSALQNGLTGPADYYAQVPGDAIPLHSVPMQSHDSEDVVLSVNKYFTSPILLNQGSCIVNLTRLSSNNGGFMVNTAVYALLQSVPSSTIGYLDGVTCSVFGGWAGNKDNPTTPLDVHFYADGVGPTKLVGKITANATRQKAVCDALGSTENPCNHGFVFNMPNSLKDGKPHVIDAYAINGSDNPKLTGSGKTITCSATKPGDFNADGKVDLLDYSILVAGFGTKYTIFDYNTFNANYEK